MPSLSEMKRKGIMMENPSETKVVKGYSRFGIQYGILFTVMAWGMVNTVQASYWQYFMTNVAMISTATVAFIILIGTIGDIIAVPISGIMMEKIRLPWGKYTSWLLVGPIIVVVMFLFMFINYPMGEAVAAVIFAVAYCLACLGINTMVTANNMAVNLGSSNPKERAILATKKGQGSALAGMVFGVIGLPIITFFNGDLGQDGAVGYMALIIILGAILFGACFFLFINLRKKLAFDAAAGEDKEAQMSEAEAKKLADRATEEKPSLGVMIKMVFTNGPLVSIILGDGLRYIGRASMLGMLVYYFKYVIEDPSGTSLFLGMSGAMALGGAILTELLVHKFPKRTMYIAGFVIMIGCYAAMYFFGTTTIAFTAIGAVWYIGLAFVNSTQVGLYSDAVDYGVYKEKKDCRAWLMAIAGYPPKMGNLGRAFITGFGLVAIGFSASAEVMAPGVIEGMRILMCVLPGGIFVIGLLVVLFGYRLTDEKMKEVQAGLQKMNLSS